MKEFKTFIFEAPRGRPPKTKQSFNEKTHGQKLESFKSGLRRLNKIYRAVNPERIDTGNRWEVKYSAKSYSQYEEARKIFLNFANNFEHWVYKELIDPTLGRSSESKNKEPELQKRVRSTAWTAFIGLSGGSAFPTSGIEDSPDFHRFIKEKDTNVRRWNENFKQAFRAIQDYIDDMGKADIIPKKDEFLSVKGVRVIIPAAERTSFHEKYIKNYIQYEIPFVVDLLNKNGFKTLTRQLEIEFNFDNRSVLGGEFHHTEKGKVTIYNLGMSEGKIARHVLIHELAHRFYYNNLKKSVRDLWDDVILKHRFVVTKSHIKTILDMADEKGNLPKNIERYINSLSDPREYLATYFIVNEIHGERIGSKEKLEKYLNRLEGTNTYKEYISNYAGKNAAEAFAEALSLYLLEGPRRLQPFTRKFLKMIVGTTGIYLKENNQTRGKMKTFKEYTESINESSSNISSYVKSPLKVIVKGVDFDLSFKKGRMGFDAILSNQHGKKVISKLNKDQDIDAFIARMKEVYKIDIKKK